MCEYFALDVAVRKGPMDNADHIISEQLVFEAVGRDIAAIFEEANMPKTCALDWANVAAPSEAYVEVASSSTSAPIYVNEPPRKYAKVNFDCLDAVWNDEVEGETDPDDAPDDFDAYLYKLSLPTRRRLRVKTSPLLTGYPNTALVTKIVYKVAMAHRRSLRASHKTEKAAAVKSALKLLAAQLELAKDFKSESDGLECSGGMAIVRTPHPSHEFQTLPSHKEVIYCRRCSSWSMNIKLKALARPCEGLKTGNKGQLRLLQLGIVPLPGVRVPGHLRRIYARGRRRK